MLIFPLHLAVDAVSQSGLVELCLLGSHRFATIELVSKKEGGAGLKDGNAARFGASESISQFVSQPVRDSVSQSV